MVPGSANTAHVHTQPQGQHGGVSGFFGSITGRRKLPDRGTAQSRSLDYPGGPGGPTLETVVEAGRGVRKLPLQPSATSLGQKYIVFIKHRHLLLPIRDHSFIT